MLTRPGLGNDALFSHTQRQKPLAEAVINLVGAGVIQILALEVDLRPAPRLGKARGKVERCWTARIVAQKLVELRVKLGIALDRFIDGVQFLRRRQDSFRHKWAAS